MSSKLIQFIENVFQLIPKSKQFIIYMKVILEKKFEILTQIECNSKKNGLNH